MKKREALKAYLDGKPIRKKSWAKNSYLKLGGIFYAKEEDFNLDLDEEGWEIYIRPKYHYSWLKAIEIMGYSGKTMRHENDLYKIEKNKLLVRSNDNHANWIEYPLLECMQDNNWTDYEGDN